MIPLESKIEDTIFPLFVLENLLQPEGFITGSLNSYGYFEKAYDYYLLRIPFYAVKGSLDFPGITVRLDRPYLLENKNQLTDDFLITNYVASPKIPLEQNSLGMQTLEEVERILLP